MKNAVTVFLFLITSLIAVIISAGWAFQPPDTFTNALPGERRDKTLSPYFFVKSDDPETEGLPLQSTRADVTISGVIADITVTQVYKNEGKKTIEAVYVFPASTRAAVYGMKMTIGERVIHAKIKKRDEARKEYEHAKHTGKNASLLEQHRPNVFQMNVANIMPGDRIHVELKYTELLVPSDGMYTVIYPTVVGPRYAGQQADEVNDAWVQNPYLHEGDLPAYDFDINVHIEAGIPIHKIQSESHKIQVKFNGTTSARVTLDNSEKQAGNRDFILTYGLAGNAIESGLLLYKGEKENYFLLMMQPPDRVRESDIPGREYIFIVDVSGSMHGFPLDVSKELLKNLVGQLRPTDIFNVLLFAGGSSLMSDHSVPANSTNITNAISFIEHQRGGGGTNILPALKRALALPEKEYYSRTVVIATDGYVAVEEQVFDLIRNNLGSANMFAFGIGSSVNRHIIEGMARAGMGEPFVITHPEKAPAQAERFRKMIQSPVLTDVNVDFGGLDIYDVEPLSIPDILEDRPVIVFGKWKGQPEGTIAVSGISGRKPWKDSISISSAKQPAGSSALKYLWARHRIRTLSDYNRLSPNDERIQDVTSLGLTHNLLTPYTSFIAVDTEVRNKGGESSTVTQPLPLPQGVSDYAVGGMSMAPAPSFFSGRLKERAKSMRPPSTAGSMPDVKADESEGYPAWLNEPSHDIAAPETEQTMRGKKGPHGSSITIEDISVSGGLKQDEIRKVIKRHLKEVRACSINTAYSMKLKVNLVIDASGAVKDVQIDRDGLRSHLVGTCIEPKIRKWLFPKARKGRDAEVSFSFVFRN